MTHGLSAEISMAYKIVQTDDRVEVYKGGELVGECESYELDYICGLLDVEYEEVENE